MDRPNAKLHGKSFIFLALLAIGPSAFADDITWFNQSLIDDKALSHFNGVLGVNMAAGNGNMQSNATAISLTQAHGRGGLAGIDIKQAITLGLPTEVYSGRSEIIGDAFAHSSGAISVNQASGVGNAQANSIAISIGISARAVSDSTLAQNVTLPVQKLSAKAVEHSDRETIISATAFHGAKGIVQLNQSAGTGNMTGNGFALSIQNSRK